MMNSSSTIPTPKNLLLPFLMITTKCSNNSNTTNSFKNSKRYLLNNISNNNSNSNNANKSSNIMIMKINQKITIILKLKKNVLLLTLNTPNKPENVNIMLLEPFLTNLKMTLPSNPITLIIMKFKYKNNLCSNNNKI